jgi:hypothetical protein
MATPELFIVLHDLALPILSFAALLMAVLYVVLEGREGSAATPE